MTTMKAARIFGPNDLRMVDLPRPKLRANDVLCKVKRCGVCGTDLAIYTGEASFVKSGAVTFPMTPGHEWSAEVAEVGPDVTNFTPGDRVVGDTCVACGHCNHCLLGQYNRCKHVRAVGTVNTWDGAYAEYIVMPERHLFHLPENVSYDAGALVEPAATALYSVRRADVTIGDTVLVHGTGPIGILAAKLAKLSGAAKVFITGRKEPKLALAKQFGADVAINTTKESPVEIVREQTNGEGVDRIIEASGAISLFEQSFDMIRVGGTISIVAFYEKPMEHFDIDKFVFTDATLRAVAGSMGMYPPILNLLASGQLNVEPLITGRYAFADLQQAIDDMTQRNDARIKLMLEME